MREQDLVVRWGGEEFLILVATREPSLTQALALRILRELREQPIALGPEQEVRISASIGFASFPLPGHGLAPDWQRAVDIVDGLMYQAKGHGRNQAWGLMGAQVQSLEALGQQLGAMDSARSNGALEVQILPGPAEVEASQ